MVESSAKIKTEYDMMFETERTAPGLSEAELYQQRLKVALKAAKICVFEVELQKQLYTFFANSEDIFGVTGDRILADVTPFSKLPADDYRRAVSEYFSHPDDFETIGRAFQSVFPGKPTTYEARMRAGDSGYIWCKIDVSPVMEDGVPVKMIGIITNIEEQKTKMGNLMQAAKLDVFTGLYNKVASIEMVKEAMRQNPWRRHALILMDIDNFKDFNDTHGHTAGDAVIRLVADSIKRCFRSTDIAGRYGGDEFMIFVEDFHDFEGLIRRLQQMVHCTGEKFCCTTSMGVAVFPEDGNHFDQLFQKADTALYHSKLNRAAITCFASLDQ